MVMYRVMRAHTFTDSRGNPRPMKPNELVNVVQRWREQELLAAGIIGPVETFVPGASVDSLPKMTPMKRVGIWLSTTPFYSGGRIHMYQYAWTLGKVGAQVFLVTNDQPRWAGDYPAEHRPAVLIIGKQEPPRDLDLIVTDSKGGVGEKALLYKNAHPRVPFVCFNFETPNWVGGFLPKYAAALEAHKEIFQRADLLIANSAESARHLREWVERDIPTFVLQPAANAPDPSDDGRQISIPGAVDARRPFAVWSSRSAEYKNGRLAMEAVIALPEPFDLVTIGQEPSGLPDGGSGHRHVHLAGIPDEQKFALLRSARMALCPSQFEGFGMVPAEALCSGTPVVAYDLPVLRQEYGDRIVYARWGDAEDFVEKTRATAADAGAKVKVDRAGALRDYGMESMESRIERIPWHAIRKTRVSVQLLAYWGFMPESLESVYDFADEVIVAFGRDPHAQEMDDGSWGRLEAWLAANDRAGKVQVHRRHLWEGGKLEMRNFCAQRATGNRMILLDGDEVWVGVREWIDADFPFCSPRWINLWHTPKHWVYDTAKLAGGRWGRRLSPYGSTCPHYRWSYWRSSYRFDPHPLPIDSEAKPIFDREAVHAEKIPSCAIYHLGHALPKKVMQAKHDFYLARDGRDDGRMTRMKVWHSWNGETGDCGDGIVEEVSWEIPEIVRRAWRGIQCLT